MSSYKVKFYKGEYRERQRNANRDKAICYVEHHFNAGSASANYACVVVGSNASQTSIKFARDYVNLIAQHFNTKLGGDKGILKGGYQGRGNANVYYTDCPTILVEPLFASNPTHAQIIKSERGIDILAECLVFAIKQNFPNGGLVAFSVGHKYKLSKPKDRGAAIYGGGSEADYAEKVLEKAAQLLTAEIKVQSEPMPILLMEDDDITEAVSDTAIPATKSDATEAGETIGAGVSDNSSSTSIFQTAQDKVTSATATFDQINNTGQALMQRKDGAKAMVATFGNVIWQTVLGLYAFLANMPLERWLVIALIVGIAFLTWHHRQLILAKIREGK